MLFGSGNVTNDSHLSTNIITIGLKKTWFNVIDYSLRYKDLNKYLYLLRYKYMNQTTPVTVVYEVPIA
jgi:hypothetical protein